MKKSHRIARKGDTARTRAQAEENSAHAGPSPEQSAKIEAAFAKAGANAEVEWIGWVTDPRPVAGPDGRQWLAPPPFPVPDGHRLFAVEIEDDSQAPALGKGDVAFIVHGLDPKEYRLAFACPHQGTPFFVRVAAGGAEIHRSLDHAKPAGMIERAELRALWAVHSVTSNPNTPEKVAERTRRMEAGSLAANPI